jgi:alanine racemase
LKFNLSQIRKHLHGSNSDVMAIVKADAYGHGMKMVALTLFQEGVRFFGVANWSEASELRRICPRAQILVLGSFHPNQVPSYVEWEIRPTVSCEEDVEALERYLPQGSNFPIHLKVDTGMGRLGAWHEDIAKIITRIRSGEKLRIDGLYTHFANADASSKAPTEKQNKIFNDVLVQVQKAGFTPRYIHTSNSMGLVRLKQAGTHLVRPGILLYGLNPWKDRKLPFQLKPVLSLRARISYLKEVPAGRSISYGSTYKTRKRTRIAVLPIGYSHGYKIAFSNQATVLVHGKACPVAGRVTMDQTLVDVGLSGNIKRWDPVTLIGREKTKSISVESLAHLADTIPYEIVCSLHSRIPRVCIGLK